MQLSFNQCCEKILKDCPNPWAKSYAREGLRLRTFEAARAQIPYLLGNISHWRGDTAKQVRESLKYIEAMKEQVE